MIVLVGELNPYGSDPRFALYDEPKHSAGGRLRRMVLGLPRRIYFGELFERGNLCVGRWSATAARAQAARVLEERPDATIVMLGRKVAGAFAAASGVPVLAPCTRVGRLVSIPHPSGLCRAWDRPETLPRVRALLAESCPHIAWGALDTQEAT